MLGVLAGTETKSRLLQQIQGRMRAGTQSLSTERTTNGAPVNASAALYGKPNDGGNRAAAKKL